TYFFSPSPDTVSAGTTVRFSFGAVGHNVRFDAAPNAPDSIPSTENAAVPRSFTSAGTYTYRCTLHGETGVVVVK
ncbi:MAG TPA: hypothetical protein VN683_03655, partial [Acidothermaceae bacterium]|nr:hypothetical protein [Acidothermaceae bacterium]